MLVSLQHQFDISPIDFKILHFEKVLELGEQRFHAVIWNVIAILG